MRSQTKKIIPEPTRSGDPERDPERSLILDAGLRRADKKIEEILRLRREKTRQYVKARVAHWGGKVGSPS
ncbi:hypothetical protein [Roseospira navarrensis]|uniref:Uncharacterized protein n=1 Tax=Roseospira navarrensis TaxID=140058 RepID=A0A7X2D2V4_9PROT|nr:hypothetical protein [Roseospira navarrensis]MQX36173.1 hypothetical protein [Roseospira navarrensis]